jgi:hypothetical protein
LVDGSKHLKSTAALRIVGRHNITQALLNVGVIRVNGQGLPELGLRSAQIACFRQTVPLRQKPAHQLLAQGLARHDVLWISRKKLAGAASPTKSLLQLPGLLEIQSPFELQRCRLPILLRNGRMPAIRPSGGAERKKNAKE